MDWTKGIDYPEWMSEEALTMFARGYLDGGGTSAVPYETPNELYKTLIEHSCSFYKDVLHPADLRDYKETLSKAFYSGWFSPATPVATNFGRKLKNGEDTKNFPVSCFSVHVGNSIDNIYAKLHESAMLSKRGGGLGIFLGDIEGSTPVHLWAGEFDSMASKVSQNGVRRGSAAPYFKIRQKDIKSVFRAKKFDSGGDVREKIDSNIAVTIPDEFMENVMKLEGDDYELFCEAIDLRMKTGSPYLTFIDNVNNQRNDIYKENDFEITTSNLCLAGETMVLTKDGHYPIEQLVSKTVEIWDGNSWVNNNMFTEVGVSNELISITLSNGETIRCTPDHKWYIHTKTREYKDTGRQVLEAKDLQIGQILDNHGMQEPEDVGSLDISYAALKTESSIYDNGELPKDILSWSYFDRCAAAQHIVLNYRETDHSRVFLEQKGKRNDSFLNQCFYLFRSVGCSASYHIDGTLTLQKHALRKIQEYLGDYWNNIKQNRIPESKLKIKDFRLTITKLERIYGEFPVYCTTVPSTHKFALSIGAITGNCSEIWQYTDVDHTFTCVLSSLNLKLYRAWSKFTCGRFNVIKAATYFLDSVCSDFINKAGKAINDKVNPQKCYIPAWNSAVKGRALGLGTMGLAAYFMREGIAFSSREAFNVNIEIHDLIDRESLKASQELAQLLGEPEWCKGHGVRNSVRIAIAPTTSNSVLCNAGTPGIEPQHGNIYSKIGAKGTFVRKNEELIKLLDKYGKNTKEVWDQITRDSGSVKNLDFLTEHEKEVFKIFPEINQFDIIKQAAQRQTFIDQGQSLNIFVPHDASIEYIVALHIYAWKLGVKGLYYLRSDSSTKKASKNTAIITQGDTTVDATSKVVIHSRSDCPYCDMAKKLLNDFNIHYEDVEQLTGVVPQIYINDEHIGGCTELYKSFGLNNPLDDECEGCSG